MLEKEIDKIVKMDKQLDKWYKKALARARIIEAEKRPGSFFKANLFQSLQAALVLRDFEKYNTIHMCAKPGCGKTMIIFLVIDLLKEMYPNHIMYVGTSSNELLA